MNKKTLTEFCFETLSSEIPLQRVSGFDAIEHLRLATGEVGGGIRIYRGDAIDKVTLVDFRFGDGIPIPHHHNKPAVQAEIFQILPDLSFKIPIWGINSIVMKDGDYYFDTDFTFGFDLVMDYRFTMKYLDPFNTLFRKYCTHHHFKRVFLDETTTWVRTYVSPVFIMVTTRVEHLSTVYELCREYIACWIRMYRDAENRGESFKDEQAGRIRSQYAGMQQTDRMGKVIMSAYGQKTFERLMQAML